MKKEKYTITTINYRPFVFVFLIILILISSCEKEKKYDKLYALEYSGINDNQKEPFFTDNFDDNTNGWSETETSLFTFKIENGYYSIYTENAIAPTKITDHYEEFQCWEIESSIKIVSNPDAKYCGLLCVGYDWLFFKEGSVLFDNDVTASVDNIINPNGEYNKLVIRKIDGTIIYFINDQKVGISPVGIKANSIGFQPGLNATIHVDYIKIFKLNI